MTDEFATPDASPRDYVPRGDAEARAKVPRDQWDRYLMPHLDGTKPARNKGFTRVSTIKSGLSNQTGIKVWTGEKIVEGLGQDTELVEASMRAATIVDPEDRKRALRKIADRAFVVGGGKDRSGKGTEFHEITEDINRGLSRVDITEAHPHLGPELTAYYRMLIDHDVQILPDMLERQVLCPYNMAGTFDNMVRWWNPDTEEWELCIADLKTGRDLSLGWLEILMQLWSYANAYGMWTTTDVTTAADGTITDVQGYYEPMPLELRKDKALIFHVPLDGTATLYVLDLSGVERYVAAAVEAKRANAEAKHKVRKVGTVTPAAFVEQPSQITIHNQPATFYPLADVGALVAEGIMHGRQQATPGQITIDGQSPATFYPYRDGNTEQTVPSPEHAAEIIRTSSRQVTPDQQAQADKAAERLAKVAAMSNPNTDGDDEPDTVVVGETVGGLRVPEYLAGQPLVTERDPVTGRKKRTCGHCRKPGHTQKNCPENPASAKFAGDVGETTPPPADPAAQAYVPDESGPTALAEPATDTEMAAPISDTAQATVRVAVAELPWCHLAHAHEWTSTHPAAPGQWVCSVSGKPSREAYEQSPQVQIIDHSGIGTEMVITQNSTPTITPPAWAAPHPNVDYSSVVLGRIASASTQAELLRLRADAIEAGHWVESLHNGPAMARYQALA